jgi:ADP-ribosyl-[dinitrogen reductase] hydrolase
VKVLEVSGASDRVTGCLVGLAVGDALGAPVEFKRRGTFAPVTGMRAGGYFRLPAGAWTDDTAMALCLAQSLLAVPDFSELDLLERFWRWLEHGENTSTGRALGVGQNTFRTLSNFRRTGALAAPPNGNRSDGNGALMRMAPVACRYWRKPELARSIAVRQSRTTHHSALSEAACELQAELLTGLIAGSRWDDCVASVRQETWPPEIEAILARDWLAMADADVNASGYVVNTLEAALWATHTSEGFSEAVLKAVNLGDDADTVGAVTGQLAGARFGMASIPPEWFAQLVDGEVIKEIGLKLACASANSLEPF